MTTLMKRGGGGGVGGGVALRPKEIFKDMDNSLIRRNWGPSLRSEAGAWT